MSLGLRFLLLDLANERDRRRRRNELRNSSIDPFDMSDADFIKTYRLSKELVESLLKDIYPIVPKERRSDGLSVQMKLLITLAFFANGSYQSIVGQSMYHFVSQPTVSRAILQITKALNHRSLLSKYVYFPNNRQDRDKIKLRFYEKFKMPGVIGCIDGTHVGIIRPSLNEERYFNRKGYHSLNVLIICDADLNILCIDPSNPGSTHDSVIWRDHPLNRHINEKYDDSEVMYLLVINTSTCVVVKSENIKQCILNNKEVPDKISTNNNGFVGKKVSALINAAIFPGTVSYIFFVAVNSDCSQDFEQRSRSCENGKLKNYIIMALLHILSAGNFLPLVAVLYYAIGVTSFGILRRRDPLDSAMFFLEFSSTGGLEYVESHVRILYAVYAVGATLLLACALAALRRHSIVTLSVLSKKYRLFTAEK